MYHSFLIHSSADGHLGYFHVLAIINSVAMNTGVHITPPFERLIVISSLSLIMASDITFKCQNLFPLQISLYEHVATLMFQLFRLKTLETGLLVCQGMSKILQWEGDPGRKVRGTSYCQIQPAFLSKPCHVFTLALSTKVLIWSSFSVPIVTCS